MEKNYTRKQLTEAVAYWKGLLEAGPTAYRRTGRTRRQIAEAVAKWQGDIDRLDERDLTSSEVQRLAGYIKDNNVDVAKFLKFEEVDSETAKKDKDVAAAYQEYVKMVKELKLGSKSVPKLHKALKDVFKGKEADAADPAKAADAVEAGAGKIEKAVSAEGAGDGKKDGEGAAVPEKAAAAVDKAMDAAKPEDVGAKGSEEAAEKAATAKPIGEMNIMDRLRRLHNATANNVVKKLAGFLPWATSEHVEVENSCVKNGQFTLPEDGNMFITVKVKVNDANRKGFKKFVAGMFGKAMNEEDLEEGVVGDFFKGLWKGSKEAAKKFAAGAKEGAQKAAETYKENVAKVNEEMKKRIGAAAIQEYVMRFCGKALAKKVNYQVIQLAIEHEGTEDAAYVFTGCVNVTR